MRASRRVVQYGLGPIGCRAARLTVERNDLELVGAVDIDPAKVGRDAGEVIGLDRALGIPVVPKLADALRHDRADVAIHTTVSRLDMASAQLVELLAAKLDVVSTAEELSFPWRAHPDAAAVLHDTARRHGRTLLGTGVNPGFLMDTLPLVLTGLCEQVHHIAVTRVIDAARRRGPFQRKIGAGLTPATFEARAASGRLGHVGLRESMHALFDALGRDLVDFETTVTAVVAERPMRSDHASVAPGQVCGVVEVARGHTSSGEFAVLTFRAELDAAPEVDRIVIRGVPGLDVSLTGTNGDIATAALAVNAVPRVVAAPPGLVTMRDLPPVTAS